VWKCSKSSNPAPLPPPARGREHGQQGQQLDGGGAAPGSLPGLSSPADFPSFSLSTKVDTRSVCP